MPVRKIPKNYRSSTGIFQSLKNKSPISYESLLERDFYLLLEFNHEVQSYEEQPLTTQYTYRNSIYRYTPDCLVQYYPNFNKLPCVFEIKFSEELKEKKVFLDAKFFQIEQYLYENDMNFKIFTELDIDPIYLENAKLIYTYASLQSTNAVKDTFNLCKKYSGKTLAYILNQISDNRLRQAEFIPYIWYLVFSSKLKIDMYKPINFNTPIRICDE